MPSWIKIMTTVKWIYNKNVHMTSIYIGIRPVSEVKRWLKSIPRLNMIAKSNQNIRGANLNDMLVPFYRINIPIR